MVGQKSLGDPILRAPAVLINIFVHYLPALLLSAFRLNGRLMANTWVAKITQETLASSCTTTGVASRMDFFSKALSV